MKYKKKLLATIVAMVVAPSITAQNIGFESGNVTDWTSSTLTAVGSTTVQAGSTTWKINPYGDYMGKLQIQNGSYSSMATALGLTSTSTTAIQTMLNQQAQVSGGNPNPTTAGWVTKEVTLTAGQQFTLAWQYVSVDYVPYNDGSIATLTQSGTNTATVNNYQQQYALLGFTNPGTGDYSTGSYGATGWQVATFDVSVSGTYTLGFGVFNMGDTALSPILFIDEVQGTTLKNNVAFGAVAPNNSTAPAAPSTPSTPSTPPAPVLTSTVGSGTTAGTGTLASSVTVNGGTIQVASTGITLTNTFTVGNDGMVVDQNGKTATFGGVISGAGGVTIANTGAGGGITFTAVNTYTGPTTINTGATLTNTGTIAGVVNNSGTFNNSGTAGNTTNSGTTTNTGTLGTVTNTGTFDNSGTAGNTTNSGTATNTGTLGTVDNSGTFNNNTGGTTSNVTNTGTFTNAGTTGTVANGGTFTNSGTTGNVTNTNAFTNTGTTGTVNNSGTFTNNGTTDNVTNQSSSTFTNAGTSGTVNNSGTFNNSGTVTSVTNNGTFDNTGTTTSVTNNSQFNNNTGGTTGAVTNNGTFNNLATTGAVTNNTDGTFSNSGTSASLTNNGTATNSGTITSTVSNAGTFTNSGTTGDVTNTAGTFTNTGTAGAVTNASTVDNSGTVGAVTNTGWFTNALNAIAGFIANSNTFTNNGTTGSVNNTGTFTNNGTTGSVTNDSTFTNAGTTGDVSNTGTFTNNGVVANVITNQGVFNNNNTTGQVLNEGTFNNAGTTSDVINAGTFTNTGTVGPVNNQGTFTTSGAAGLVTNTGTLTMNGGTLAGLNNTGTFTVSGGTLGSYTQTNPGKTIMFMGTPFTVTGAAALGGGLKINDSPTAYGKYTAFTAGSITGEYTLLGTNGVNDYLKYSNNEVKLYVTPSASVTQSSIGATASNVSSMNNLQAGVINNSLGNDCNLFGDEGACISVNLANTAASSGDLASGGTTIAKRFNDNWKAGLFLTSPFNNPTIGGVSQKNNPAYGGFVGWNQDPDGIGFGVQASIVTNTGKMTVTRSGPEIGVGTSTTNGTAYQLKGTFSHQTNDKTTLTDYIGIRHTKLNMGGYTETGPAFPLTVNGTQQTTTDLIAGVGVSHNVNDKLTANVNVGVIQNLSNTGGTFSGTSEIGNLQTFNTALPTTKYTSAAFGAGVTYALSKNERIGASVGWQQKSLSNASVTSYGLNYTVGF